MSWTESKSERSVSRYDINTTRSSSDPSATAFYTALYSSDPDVALNFFGNGTAQGGNFSDLLTETARSDGSTESSTYNILLSGELVVFGLETSLTRSAQNDELTEYEGTS